MVFFLRHLAILLCVLVISGAPPVAAAGEDASLFQELLAPYGQWLQYGQYGLVWRPTQVDRTWQPYTNGRWVLTQDGYVFETDEPWGWATYHYGNWLQSPEYGWLWVPGHTWYPHTVTWRSNDEHVGWAPVPPPDASGTDISTPADAASAFADTPTGYRPASLPASSWIFTRSNDFLYGWGEPYSSRYSYYNAGLLLAPWYVPTIYERTVYIYNYVTPAYAPRACFNWGPPLTYLRKVRHLKQHDLHHPYQRHRLDHLRNVLPPKHILERHAAWRQLVPVAAPEGQRPTRWWTPAQNRGLALNRPDALPLPASLTKRAGAMAAQPGAPLQLPPALGKRPTSVEPGRELNETLERQERSTRPLHSGQPLPLIQKQEQERRPAVASPGGRVAVPPEQPEPPTPATSALPWRPKSLVPGPSRVQPRQQQDQNIKPPRPLPAALGANSPSRPIQPAPTTTSAPPKRLDEGVSAPSRQGDLPRWHGGQPPRLNEPRRLQQPQDFHEDARRRQQEQQQRQNLILKQQEQPRHQADIQRLQQEQQRQEMFRQQQAQQQRQAKMIREQQEQQRLHIERRQQQQQASQSAPPREDQPQRKKTNPQSGFLR